MKNKIENLALTAILFVMTACAIPRDSSVQTDTSLGPTPRDDPGKTIFFPRQPQTQGERAVMEGETTGTLILTEQCIRLNHD